MIQVLSVLALAAKPDAVARYNIINDEVEDNIYRVVQQGGKTDD